VTTMPIATPSQKRSKLEGSLISAIADRVAASSSNSSPWRNPALRYLEQNGLPARTEEAFRFSPIGTVSEQLFVAATEGLPLQVEPLDGGAISLVFVNGIPQAPPVTPKGMVIVRLSEAGAVVASKVGSLIHQQDGWVAANTAGYADGIAIVVDDATEVAQALEMTFVQTAESAATYSASRVVILVGRGSKLSVVERHLSVGDAKSLSNQVVECFVGAGSTVNHSRWTELGDEAHQVAATAVSLSDGASYSSFALNHRGKYVRHDLQVRLKGRHASATLDGLYYGRTGQLVDNHVRVWHEAPEGSTKECYRGVVENQGKGVFDGIIYVCKGAMKTDARQENRNLLLGPEAVVYTKPHLEIDADDVACSHGATVGQLDENQLFYLQARGIDAALGRELLTWAFAKEIVERCPYAPLRALATAKLEGKLRDEVAATLTEGLSV